MSDTKTLRINIKNSFKELPDKLDISYAVIEVAALAPFDSLFDEKAVTLEGNHAGILVPLVVLPAGDGTYRIVDGCKRFYRGMEQKRVSMPCQVIATELDPTAAGLLRIMLNRDRPWQTREAFLFYAWQKDTFPDKKRRQVTANLGFNAKTVHQFDLLCTMETSEREAFLSGFIEMSLIENFRVFSKEDRHCFLETFREFSLSFQIQREFLEWLPEIAAAKSVSITEVLRHKSITETIENKTLNAPQKLRKIRSLLSMKKFPLLSAAEKKWKELSDKTNPDRSCVFFGHNPCFEKNKLEITVTVTAAKRAPEVFKKLSEIPPDTWKKLIYPL